MQRLICSSILLSALTLSAAETPPPVALNFRVGAGAHEGQGIALDGNGNIYATGQYAGEGTFGAFTLTNGGSFDYYISAHDPTGQVLWAQRAGVNGADFGSDVIVDHSGNVVVAGVIEGTNDFHGVTNVSGFGLKDIFLAKYTSGDTLMWVRLAGGTANDQAFDVAEDGSGNYFVSCRIGGVATFGSTNVGAAFQTRCVLAKCSSDGQFLWAVNVGGTGSTETSGVAADTAGNAYITGLSTSPNGPFTAKFDSAGTQLWKHVIPGNSFFDEGSSVTYDAGGNVYVGGRFTTATSLTFGSTTITNPGGVARGFIAKYDSAGTPLWAKAAGARAFDVFAYPDGTLYAAGFFNNTATNVDTEVLVNQGSLDMYSAKFDPTGNLVWVQSAGTGSTDLARAITTGAGGSTFVIGEGGTELFENPVFPGGVYVIELRPAVANPALGISISGSDLVVSWPQNFSGYSIETKTNISGTFQTGTVPFTPVGGMSNTFSTPKPSQDLFIRLSKP